jgi:hypothetical protein
MAKLTPVLPAVPSVMSPPRCHPPPQTIPGLAMHTMFCTAGLPSLCSMVQFASSVVNALTAYSSTIRLRPTKQQVTITRCYNTSTHSSLTMAKLTPVLFAVPSMTNPPRCSCQTQPHTIPGLSQQQSMHSCVDNTMQIVHLVSRAAKAHMHCLQHYPIAIIQLNWKLNWHSKRERALTPHLPWPSSRRCCQPCPQ